MLAFRFFRKFGRPCLTLKRCRGVGQMNVKIYSRCGILHFSRQYEMGPAQMSIFPVRESGEMGKAYMTHMPGSPQSPTADGLHIKVCYAAAAGSSATPAPPPRPPLSFRAFRWQQSLHVTQNIAPCRPLPRTGWLSGKVIQIPAAFPEAVFSHSSQPLDRWPEDGCPSGPESSRSRWVLFMGSGPGPAFCMGKGFHVRWQAGSQAGGMYQSAQEKGEPPRKVGWVDKGPVIHWLALSVSNEGEHS